MEWVETFYARQDAWLGIYTGPVTVVEGKRAAAVARLAGPGPKRILELGAGGGQTAFALAEAGHTVVAVELVPTAARHAQELARTSRSGSITVVEGDFYMVQVEGPFDVVCYWDGFGIGSDVDQQRLLRRVVAWLVPDGCALLDVNTPWYWSRVAGQEMRWPNVVRRYDFDAEGCRLLDRWWPAGDESQAVTQSLRCYSPADLSLLLAGTGLRLSAVEPGGAVDYATGSYTERAPLREAMQYLAKLVRE